MLQAGIESASVCQAATGDTTLGQPFSANASSHQRTPAQMTGTMLPLLN